MIWLLLAVANDPDPYGGSGTWVAPPPLEQAVRDATIPPSATGAVFVPMMTEAHLEPQYMVLRGEQVIESPAGSKTWLRPGTYRVLVGTGAPEARLEYEVDVVEGETTFVPVEWSGLVVSVVNARGTSFRGSYEVVRLPARQFIALGRGASISEGEDLTTMILRPGLYMLLSEGESYRARKNFATVRLLPGELVHYTLVIDDATGDILGAGQLDEGAGALDVEGPWDVSMLLGGSMAINRADSVVGKSEGTSLDATAFVETVLGFSTDDHVAYARLYLEEAGSMSFSGDTYVSEIDQLRMEALYMWRLWRWFGPYARVSSESNLVPGRQEFEAPTDVVRIDVSGQEIGREQAVDSTKLTDSFSPIDLRVGAGARFDVNPRYWFRLTARAGFGSRNLFARNLFLMADDPGTPALDLVQKSDVHQNGAEGSILTELRLTRWVLFRAELDVLAPFSDWSRRLVDLQCTTALRLGSFASLNYTVRLVQDPALTEATQFDQAVLLRFAYKLF
jgi:hypothetical protein